MAAARAGVAAVAPWATRVMGTNASATTIDGEEEREREDTERGEREGKEREDEREEEPMRKGDEERR